MPARQLGLLDVAATRYLRGSTTTAMTPTTCDDCDTALVALRVHPEDRRPSPEAGRRCCPRSSQLGWLVGASVVEAAADVGGEGVRVADGELVGEVELR